MMLEVTVITLIIFCIILFGVIVYYVYDYCKKEDEVVDHTSMFTNLLGYNKESDKEYSLI